MFTIFKPNYIDAVQILTNNKIIGGTAAGPLSKIRLAQGVIAPTEEAIETQLAELIAEWDAQEYARKRQAEYPSIVDVTVALAEKEEGQPHFWNEITALRLEVKSKYPKP